MNIFHTGLYKLTFNFIWLFMNLLVILNSGFGLTVKQIFLSGADIIIIHSFSFYPYYDLDFIPWWLSFFNKFYNVILKDFGNRDALY